MLQRGVTHTALMLQPQTTWSKRIVSFYNTDSKDQQISICICCTSQTNAFCQSDDQVDTFGTLRTCAGSHTGVLHVFALLVVIVEGVHGLLVLPIHPALLTETQSRTNVVPTTPTVLA